MAKKLSAEVFAAVHWVLSQTNSLGGGTQQNYNPKLVPYEFTNGFQNGQLQEIFVDRRTIAPSATDTLDLYGTLNDPLNRVVNFNSLKVILVQADPANVNNIMIGGNAAGPSGIFANLNDKIVLSPGGVFLWMVPNIGASVVDSTGDKLDIANAAPNFSVNYNIILAGTAA